MTNPILSTKLYIPRLPKFLVPRLHLLARLDEGRGGKLTLVTAPAGYGKTTVLSEWVQRSDMPAAWLTLDERDNDPARFLAYLIAALQTINEQITTAALEGFRASPTPHLESVLTGLVNEIALFSDPFLLVMDDYQAIDLQPIQEAVGFLVEHIPPQLHLVIGSRIDPPLPLSRWRARGQLTELREADLRFTPAETAEFFTQTLDLNLDQQDLDALATHTEGWIAGLQLAGISIKDRPDKSAFVAEFSGSHEFIVDYLTDEVLEKIPESTRNFLLQTSILDRLTGELCDEVTGLQGGQSTIEGLRENHLFLMPLDDERRWYRFHALFADLLHKRLLEEQAQLIPLLHQRASRWFDRNGDAEQAIRHALKGKDFERALSIVERIAEETLARTEFKIFLNWMDAIPSEVTQSKPRLLVLYAAALLFSGGDPQNVENLLLEAADADEKDELAGEVAAMHAMIATLKGDVENSIKSSHQAMESLPEGNTFLRSLVTGNLSVAYVSTGDVKAAGDLFSNAAREGERAGNYLSMAMALRRLAEIALLKGDLHQAWDICERGIRLAVYPNGNPLPVAGILMAVQGDILREWDDLPAALESIQDGIELVLRWSELAAIENYLYLARVKRSLGDAQGAQSALDTARQIAEWNPASRIAPFIISLFQGRLWLQLGELSKAEGWAREYQPFKSFLNKHGYNPQYHHHLLEIEGIAFARLYLAGSKWEAALELLEPLHQAALDLNRTGSVIEILVLKAVAYSQGSDLERAVRSLEQALRLAEPQGYLRMFIDEGESMHQILTLTLDEVGPRDAGEPQKALSRYINRLLAAFTAEAVVKKEPVLAGIAESLSARELEVLRFLATPLTSTEIAQELYISPNTARFHIKNIYSKLGVHGRAEAVERAKELGLL